MEYTIIGKVFPIILKNIVKKELKKYFTNIEIKDIIKNTKTEYKNIINRTPNMGGNKNYYIGIMYLGIYFEFAKCGLCELCKSENVSELTPLMCEMDFISFNFANCRLIREKTLSNGNEYCDFWIRKNE